MTQTAQSAKDLFLAALELPHNARPGWLDEACSGDDALRRQVDALLRMHDEPDSLLDQPRIDLGLGDASFVTSQFAPTVSSAPIAETPGTVIGPYKLLEQIGEGGFGVVFMAEQTAPVKRRVALKVIKPGMDTREVIARFEAERQALALMDHPNIAKVFEAGATGEVEGQGWRVKGQGSRAGEANSLDPQPLPLGHSCGRPFFVMELVRGIPITEYCDEHQLTPRERLELFVTVCQAVQHAHQKGIIHRDIKPTNVLVTLHDDKPVVKVIDFGIAKATSGQLTDKTLFTGFAQLVGTPLYMSPEQASLNGLDVDTRSDIYSLGVLLYELLTGTTPFDKTRLQDAGFDEVRRIIREEHPASPSARVSTLGQAASTVSANRKSDPNALCRQFRGEPDWIVMKCLEKDRNRRYESASALARDVERHLRNEPVQACPPSYWYRFRKFARRNRSALVTASVVGMAVLVALTALAISTLLTADALQDTRQAKSDLEHALERERQDGYFHRITLAHQNLSTDNLGRALELLEECPEDLRDWEWRYLMRLCRIEPLVLQDDAEINGLSFSPDGERLASAGGDGAVKIWNSRTGEVIRILEQAHVDSVVCVVFHPDGDHVASTGADRQVKVWNLTTAQEVFNGPCDAVRKFGTAHSVAFSPDGRLLAAGSDGAVMVWDWKSRQLLHTFPGHEQNAISVAFSPDGRRLASACTGADAKLWDLVAGGRLLRTFPAHRHPVGALAFSPDGSRLAEASFGRSANLWDTVTGEPAQNFPHTGNVLTAAFSPDGRRLVSAGEDKTIHVWDPTTGREVLGLRGHTGMCGCVAFSPDGRRLASVSTDGTIRVWDATPLRGDEGQETLSFTQHSDEIRSVVFSPDGRRIASACRGRFVKVWDAATGEMSVEFDGQTDVVFCLAWQPGGQRIASAGWDGRLHTVWVWDAWTGKPVFELPPDADAGFAVAFSPDDRYLVTGKGSGAVQVWNARTGQPVSTLGSHAREIRGVVFSRDGRHLASASDGEVKFWDPTRLDEQQEARLTLRARVPGSSLNVAFSPDGRRLATGGEENTVKIWDVETGGELTTLRGHSGEVYTLAFSPDDDGRWLASAGEDSAVKVWDSHTGELEHSFRGHTGLISSVAFSPDGRRLASGSRDTTVKLWDITPLNESTGKNQRAVGGDASLRPPGHQPDIVR